MKVTIVGGGIGGLSTALLLNERGIDVEIFEQSVEIRELGVGINTLPRAIEVLADIGLLSELDKVAIRTNELYYLNRLGQEVWREVRGIPAGHRVPQFSIHRGRLQLVLLRAVLERIGKDRVHTGMKFERYERNKSEAVAHFIKSGSAEASIVAADVLVGADGIHSTVRKQMVPFEGPPRWSGLMVWRGAVDWPLFLDGRSMIVAGGLESKVVIYPIGPGQAPRSRLTNWGVISRFGSRDSSPPRREDWNRKGTWKDLWPRVEAFRIPQVDFAVLMRSTPEFWEWPMCDRDPLDGLSIGRVTLLGDAAHPMYPVGSNGASQAILDAKSLADCLSAHSKVEAALLEYDQIRRPPTSEIVQANRLGGPEGVIDVVDAIAPNGFDDIEKVLPRAKREEIVRGRAGAAAVPRAI